MSVMPANAGLAALALAALGQATASRTGLVATSWKPAMLAPTVAKVRERPDAGDRRLVLLAETLKLSDTELLTVALCVAAARDAEVARTIAEVQHPVGGSRLLLGSVVHAFAMLGGDALTLASGQAVANGILELGDEPAALPERSVSVPLAILSALTGQAGAWPGVLDVARPAVALPDAMHEEAGTRARLLNGNPASGLLIRSPSLPEAIAAACLVAEALERPLARIDGVPARALPGWLIAAQRVPLFVLHAGPGERWPLPDLGGYPGPWIAVAGMDGAIETETQPDEWTMAVPDLQTRTDLWRGAGATAEDAARAAASFRQGAGRIAEVARRAQLHADRRGARRLHWDDITAGVASGTSALDAMARRSNAHVPDDALVLPEALGDALERLVERVTVRSNLADRLGAAMTARYRPGVRALFTGESGTGKTLAAHWLAGKLGMPLYRVDMSELTSKWIGETEKNLSRVLSAAEHADVILFFDEADSLFGSRTEVKDSNDRFGNAQTNFLLQRIEEFDGIVLLASNSRDRFDQAFARRLDTILEFPMPEAPARRGLWEAHLGDGHDLAEDVLDRLALSVDLAGGHIRNIVLAAAARGKAADRDIAWRDIIAAVDDEYGKLGRPPPKLVP